METPAEYLNNVINSEQARSLTVPYSVAIKALELALSDARQELLQKDNYRENLVKALLSCRVSGSTSTLNYDG